MPKIMSIAELRNSLCVSYSQEVLSRSRLLRQENIEAFLSIDRGGLRYESLEHRILLYTSLQGEKVYIQLPGKESVESNRNPMPKDFRPKLECVDGSMMQDASFGYIWDILDEIGRQHRDYLSIVATVFFHMGYMYNYTQTSGCYECSALLYDDEVYEIRKIDPIEIRWNHIDFSDDVWHSLNNYLGDISVPSGQTISFESFIKFVDLLLQNEDCKYYYKNVVQGNKPSYNLKSGRTSTCDANLLVLHYLKGEGKISRLLDSFQKTRGVPSFNKSEYPLVTDGIVSYDR